MSVRLYVLGRKAQIETLLGAPAGTINRCKAIMDAAYSQERQMHDENECFAYEPIEEAQAKVAEIDPYHAYEMVYGDYFGRIIMPLGPGEYAGQALGSKAVPVLLAQRAYPARNRCDDYWDGYWQWRAEYRAMCDKVALACADGRLYGVYWA